MSPRSLARLASLIILVALAALAAVGAAPAQGASFTVDATHDAVDASPGDGVCADAGGACTLRAAVMETHALAGPDEISLPTGTYVLSIAGAGEDASATGDLDVTADLTITGAGVDNAILDAGAVDRVIHIFTGTVSITDVMIRNGLAGGSSATSQCHPFPEQQNGGGVCNEAGDATLERVDVVSNKADRHGSGIYNAGSFVLGDSSVRNNPGPGHGIVNDGAMTVARTEIRENDGYGFWNRTGTAEIIDTESIGNFRGLVSWSSQALTFTGGRIADSVDAGIHHIGDALVLTNVTVAGNQREGIVNGAGFPSRLFVTESTISGNSSSGIANGGPTVATGHNIADLTETPQPGEVYLTNVTISSNGNVAGHGLDNLGLASLLNVTIAHNFGVGVLTGPQGGVSLRNTLIGDNSGPDCGGSAGFTSLGSNLDTDGTCGLTGPGDLSEGYAGLGPLADNGGPTQTHEISRLFCFDNSDVCVAPSDAIDAGVTAPACPPADQRGEPRPFDGDGDGVATCDIGAYEQQQGPRRCEVACSNFVELTPTPTAVPIPTPAVTPASLPASGGDAGSSPKATALAMAAIAVMVVAGGAMWRSRRGRR